MQQTYRRTHTSYHSVISIILFWGYFSFTEITLLHGFYWKFTAYCSTHITENLFTADLFEICRTIIPDETLCNSYNTCSNTNTRCIFRCKFCCILLNNNNSGFSCHVVASVGWYHIEQLWPVKALVGHALLQCCLVSIDVSSDPLCLKMMMYRTVTRVHKLGWWNPKVPVLFFV